MSLDRRTYSPVLRQADLPDTIAVPWLGGRTLRYEYTLTTAATDMRDNSLREDRR